jgi:hypothetical protein
MAVPAWMLRPRGSATASKPARAGIKQMATDIGKQLPKTIISRRGAKSTTKFYRPAAYISDYLTSLNPHITLTNSPEETQAALKRGQVAQLVEQRTENPRVGGSTPSLATTPSYCLTDSLTKATAGLPASALTR